MLKNISNVLITQTRNCMFKSKLKIKWSEPEKLKCFNPKKSGETEPFEPIPDTTPGLFFSQTEKLKDVDENVKKLCSVGHLGGNNSKIWIIKRMMDRVRSHQFDEHSAEARIALITARIRLLQNRIVDHPYDHKAIQACKLLVDKRQKYLRKLRTWDYKKYEWLLEKLEIIYKAPPTTFTTVNRKLSLSKLTKIYCENVKIQKMEEYKEQLLKEREQLLLEYGIDPSETTPYLPEWCPSDTKTQMAKVEEVPDPL